MKYNATVLAILVGGLMTGAASGDLVVQGSGGAGWQAFPGTLNNYNNAQRAYWDQDTKDQTGNPTTNRNVGNYLNNTWTGALPGGSAPSPNITPSWWGNASTPDFYASMDNNVGFAITNNATQVSTTMRLELSGYSSSNVIGWYDLSDAVGSETLHVIYTGANAPTTSVVFTPSANFGLYIRTGGNHLFFSQSARNRADGGAALQASDLSTQHFAIFQRSATAGSESYIVGVEDLQRSQAGREVVGDYNDIIFTLTAVPTPGATALLGLGGLLVSRRRR